MLSCEKNTSRIDLEYQLWWWQFLDELCLLNITILCLLFRYFKNSVAIYGRSSLPTRRKTFFRKHYRNDLRLQNVSPWLTKHVNSFDGSCWILHTGRSPSTTKLWCLDNIENETNEKVQSEAFCQPSDIARLIPSHPLIVRQSLTWWENKAGCWIPRR